MQQDDVFRQRTAVAPQNAARRRVEGDDLVARRGHEHDAVVDDRRRLMSVVDAGRDDPRRLQACDIAGSDLRQWTIAPAVVGPSHHQPVAVLRLLETVSRHWLVILQCGQRCRPLLRGSESCRASQRKRCGDRAERTSEFHSDLSGRGKQPSRPDHGNSPW